MFGWSVQGWPVLCNFVQFGHATLSKNILQLCPKRACKKQADYNIFCYDTKIRLEFEVKKNHRNVCAHNKERIISNATVEDLWDFIAYVKPLSVINGTSQYLIKMINDVIRFCNKSEYKEKAKDIIRFYNKICGEEKKKVFIELCKMVNLYYSVDSNIFMIELFELIFYKADVEEYQWISQDCKIELFVKINISNYMKELDKVQFYRYAESTDKDWSRFEISAPTTIMKNGNNDLLKKKFLLEVYNDENHYNNWSNMLLVSDKWQNYIYESEIISIIKKSENVDSVLNEIEKLYQYNSFYGWKQTNTFDYCNFVADDKIARKVKMILLLVMKGEIDITNKKISELINRCKMVINITDNKNNCYYISEYLRRNEELFSWLQSIEITH